MTRKPKPKPVRCWMYSCPTGNWWFVYTKESSAIEKQQEFGGTITPGHFVPEKKKARRK